MSAATTLPSTHAYYKFGPAHTFIGGITPGNIPGLIVWNRSDNLTAGTTLSTWANESNTATGPTISCNGVVSTVAAGLNGIPVVRFTTTSMYWKESTAPGTLALSNITTYTFFYVAHQIPSSYGRVFQSATTYVPSTNSGNQLHGYWNGSNHSFYTVGNPNQLVGLPYTNDDWAIIGEKRTAGGAYEFRWNGATIASGSTSTSFPLEGLSINAGSINEPSTCEVAEVILYNTILNTQQILGIEQYLRDKWDL
jgi:hypothetical protein